MSDTYSNESLVELFDEETVGQLQGSNENFRALRSAYKALKEETKELKAEYDDICSKRRGFAVSNAGFDPHSKQAELLIGMASEDPDADPFAAGTYSELAEAIGMKPAPPEQSDDDAAAEHDDEEDL